MKKFLVVAAIVSLILTACSSGQGTAVESSTSQASSSQTDKLNIYNWSGYVGPATLSAFENKMHINTRYDYYDSNKALGAKLLTDRSGYDLAAPSIANVGRQTRAGAYQKTDKSQIPDCANIDPDLLKTMETVDPGNEYAAPYFWDINMLAINKQQIQRALGADELPENEWDLVPSPEYTRKLKSCGISYFNSAIEQIPLVLHYLGKDPNSENPEGIKAAVNMMKRVCPDIKRLTPSGYIDGIAAGNLCVSVGHGSDLSTAKAHAREAGNGVEVEVLTPKNGVGTQVDPLIIPCDAQSVVDAHKYIDHTLNPEIAARNSNHVTYALISRPARDLTGGKYTSDESILPSKRSIEESFIVFPRSTDTSRLSACLWQALKAER